MKINENLPFEHCEKCPEFILNVDEQVIFTDGVATRTLNVGCKHEWLCKQIAQEVAHEMPVQR